MKKIYLTLSLISIVIFSGCETTGLSTRENGVISYNEMVYAMNDHFEGDEMTTSEIVLPIRLGIAQIGETSPNELLLSLLRKHTALFSDIIEIPLTINEYSTGRWSKNDYQKRSVEFRKLAKQLGTTHILMIGGHIDSRKVASEKQIFDILILPAFFVNSHNLLLEARASAALIETNSGRIQFLMNVTADNEGKSPTFYLDQRRETLSVELKDELSEKMVSELIKRL